ncbi:2-iminobutanoate/2-iminopropanoate deaminase [Pseudonocardia thermophila]|uniref:2-iminobutanoate/2-iminopropanoate deaminase n=1 Tax=Pseudonocardia thermophila TaxID=1848 RepID=A0A1M6WQL6_PSETH|nr:RidA family protein [Pseudonocardia thermophila]SHK95879.1 2-iminobutanoate/2-iminopropanoate deaminase [Pseudonocardia thermophila]
MTKPPIERRHGFTTLAPPPAGPYSQAVRAGGIVVCAGQAGITPDGTPLGGLEAQLRQTFANIAAALATCDATLADVISTRVFLTDPAQFEEMNAIYREFFSEPYPARTTVYVGLPAPLLVEVDCLAVV